MTAAAQQLEQLRYRKPIKVQPPHVPHGYPIAALGRSLIERADERALIIEFCAHRRRFGLAYWMLQPDFFDSMPRGSGVFLKPIVPTHEIFPGVHRPGDIDLLVLPYDNHELILERTMAIEFKVIRATFNRQGKSPNDFGYSQAHALLGLGIPYVAIGHLIVSDASPEKFWREMTRCRVLGDSGRVGDFANAPADMMPADLMRRALGRLCANASTPLLGLFASYIGQSDILADVITRDEMWIPECQRTTLNPETRIATLNAIEAYFQKNASRVPSDA